MMRNIALDDYFDMGISRGEHNARIETARNLFALGVVTPSQIAQVTGLSLAEVHALAK